MGISGEDSLLYKGKWRYFFPDSLASIYRMLDDSLMFFNKDEFRQEMQQLQKEMEKMREEMKRLRIEIHKDTLHNQEEKTSIEI